MGSLNSREVAYLLDGLVHVAVSVVLVVIGLVIGWNVGLNSTQDEKKRRRHRGILWSIAIGALLFSVGMFFMVEETGFYTRSDGVVTVAAGWFARAVLAAFVVWALLESIYMTLSNTMIVIVVVLASYGGAILCNYVSTDETFAISLVAWGVFWLTAAVLTVIWTNTKRQAYLLGYISIGHVYLFALLQGLWLVLGDTVADVSGFNRTTEAYLLFATDVLFTGGATVLIGLAYFGNQPNDSFGLDNVTKKFDAEAGTPLYNVVKSRYAGRGVINRGQ